MSAPSLIQRLAYEADWRRNDGAHDIAALLDEARAALAARTADAGERELPPLPERGEGGYSPLTGEIYTANDMHAYVEAAAPVICGQSAAPIDPDLVGCGKPILNAADVFRCTDCGVPFHRECAKLHFATDTPEHAAEVIEKQLARLDGRAPAETERQFPSITMTDAPPLAEALQHLRNSVEWMMEGKHAGPCIGVADMLVIERALASPTPPVGGETLVAEAKDYADRMARQAAEDGRVSAILTQRAHAAIDALAQAKPVAEGASEDDLIAQFGLDMLPPDTLCDVRGLIRAARGTVALAQGAPAVEREPNGWIPVSERLPAYEDDESVHVLVRTDDHDFAGVKVHDIPASDFYFHDFEGNSDEPEGTEVTQVATHRMYRDDALGGNATPSTVADVAQGEARAWRDVTAERRRQIEAEGWTPEHDDEHADGQIAAAAAAYAKEAAGYSGRGTWPWRTEWWKPRDPRSNLVRAGALILAEIERLDRAATTKSRFPCPGCKTPAYCTKNSLCDTDEALDSGITPFAASPARADQEPKHAD